MSQADNKFFQKKHEDFILKVVLYVPFWFHGFSWIFFLKNYFFPWMLNSRVRKEQKENGGKVWIVQNENQSYGEAAFPSFSLLSSPRFSQHLHLCLRLMDRQRGPQIRAFWSLVSSRVLAIFRTPRPTFFFSKLPKTSQEDEKNKKAPEEKQNETLFVT